VVASCAREDHRSAVSPLIQPLGPRSLLRRQLDSSVICTPRPCRQVNPVSPSGALESLSNGVHEGSPSFLWNCGEMQSLLQDCLPHVGRNLHELISQWSATCPQPSSSSHQSGWDSTCNAGAKSSEQMSNCCTEKQKPVLVLSGSNWWLTMKHITKLALNARTAKAPLR
jgi:hypothetical protein